ncbi:MAG TPA: methylenetetrahydrofolate reductase [NAD(P)H] [Candidatus Saccharimonadales bacterium]|nr:methylenetetrahydrofolate reductase [NAD(P)H] [Candidatus Saccharimonadales bacterium]
MKIIDILARSNQPIFSLEFFPPKTEEGMTELIETLKKVKTLNPGYISVTYGAGGGTRDRTLDIVKYAKRELGLESMAHLTCVGHSKEEIKNILDEIQTSGIDNVVALRGDPPKGESIFKPNPHGFKYASELTAFIRASYPLCVAVAGYPEGHIESPSKETDWNYLTQKVKAGADFIITQLFFDNTNFFIFENRMREKGVRVPIIPGIMPITNYHQILRFTQMCGAKMPEQLMRGLQPIQNNVEEVQRYGIEYATRQCEELIAHGVPGIHFYTLNKSNASWQIIRNIRP